MIKIKLTVLILIGLIVTAYAQAPDTMWLRTFGDTEWDCLNWVEETFNVGNTGGGGYISCGTSRPFGNGSWNALLILTDPFGQTIWSRTFDFSSTDCGNCVKPVGSDGFILCGMTIRTNSNDGNVLVVRTDDLGDTIWTSNLGTERGENALCLDSAPDNCFVITGFVREAGGGSTDIFVLKIDEYGNQVWYCEYGQSNIQESGWAIARCSNGGHVIAGVNCYHPGGPDAYLMHIDDDGNMTWDRHYGGTGYDSGLSVVQTSDGGFILCGNRTIIDIEDHDDIYLIKTDNDGYLEWERTIGGARIDRGFSVGQCQDGGYIITGCTYSYGAGEDDIYIVKTDYTGSVEWTKIMGDPSFDHGTCVRQTADGGYILSGGVFTAFNCYYDGFLMKLDPDLIGIDGNNYNLPGNVSLFQNYPNPFNTSTRIWYGLPEQSQVSLEVYNLLGQRLVTLFENIQQAGKHCFIWDAADYPSGIYFARLKAFDRDESIKMLLLK